MPIRSTRTRTRLPRLASRASLLAALALPAGLPAETALFQGAPVEVLGRRTTLIPGGSVTFIRIRPPALPPRPASPPPAPDSPPFPETQAAMEREASRIHATLAVTATVYTRPDGSAAFSELSWHEGGRVFRIWSAADFRLLRQLGNIPLETHRFQWFPFVDALPLADLPADRTPAGLALFPSAPAPDALPEYCFEGSAEDAVAVAPTLAAFDWLHAYYHLHRAELAADLARREAESVAQARRAAEDAAKPKAHTVYFWKIN